MEKYHPWEDLFWDHLRLFLGLSNQEQVLVLSFADQGPTDNPVDPQNSKY